MQDHWIQLAWILGFVAALAILWIWRSEGVSEKRLLRRLSAKPYTSTDLKEVLSKLAHEAGAPWSLRRLKLHRAPRLFEIEEPGAHLLVARGRFSSGSIILGQGFIRKASHFELEEGLKQALLRLKEPKLPRATAGTAALLGLMGNTSKFKRWIAWSVLEGSSQTYEGSLQASSFRHWLGVILASPIVDFFTRKSATAPWILETPVHLQVLSRQARPTGWLPRLTQGLQPQFPVS